MTKEVTIKYKGVSRRIELQNPGNMERMHHLATAPTPLEMKPETLGWMNATIAKGSELDLDAVESLSVTIGLSLLSEVLGYWGELNDGDIEEAEKDGGDLEGIELNDEGVVELEDMQ